MALRTSRDDLGKPGSAEAVPTPASLVSSSNQSNPAEKLRFKNQGDILTGSQEEIDIFKNNKLQELLKDAEFSKAAILGGFVPDCILAFPVLDPPYLRSCQGVAFVVDIAGFTALTEAYSLNGKGGTEQLTKTLANYMGPLAQCIMESGGDIIKYAGDAFLALWRLAHQDKVSADDYPELLQKAIDCALFCQERYGSYVTDVQITIKVKIGIGAGECYMAGLGNNYSHHYAVFGQAVYDAASAEHQCVSGNIILHESARKHLDPIYYTLIPLPDGFARVTEIVHYFYPFARGRKFTRYDFRNFNNSNKSSTWDEHHEHVTVPTDVRPTLEKEVTPAAEAILKKLMIPPVIKKLDDNVPLDYLNESRMVSIVFIHVSHSPFELNESFGNNMLEVIQACFLTIYKSVTSLNGCLTKVIMFDKGLTYLVVFGLPGYMQDNQAANSLTSAGHMMFALKAVPNVVEVSIGCTTGSTYCGVLGHPKRHEYTVIGKQVNKAARLMCYYPGKVTCSQDTLFSSKLPHSYFLQLESKALKGISNVGKIYEFLGGGVEKPSTYLRKQYEFPLLGRNQERESILKILKASRQEFERNLATEKGSLRTVDLPDSKSLPTSSSWMIVIEGEDGIGKTRLASACMEDAEILNWTVFTVSLSIQHAALNLYTVENLLLQYLGMERLHTSREREKHLSKLISISRHPELINEMWAFNDVFHLKFLTPSTFVFADDAARHDYIQRKIALLLTQVLPGTMILFCVEDAHYMSQSSWDYLQFISRLPTILTLMTLRRNPSGIPRIPDNAYKICYHSPHVTTIRLGGMADKYILPLVCQFLEVHAIPQELEKIIIMKSQGNPSWVYEMLEELLSQDKLKLIDQSESQVTRTQKNNLIKVGVRYITKKVLLPNEKSKPLMANSEYTFLVLDSDITMSVESLQSSLTGNGPIGEPTNRICVLKSNTDLHSTSISGGLKEKMLDLLDSLSSNDQLLVKCACVLGPKFSRTMLNHLLPLYAKDAEKYLLSFQNLMEKRILACASRTTEQNVNSAGLKKTLPVRCFCAHGELVSAIFDDDLDQDLANMSLPSYCYCRYVKFSRESMVEVLNELLTENLKKELHSKAAKYLEITPIQCVSCGGPQTMYLYGFDLDDENIDVTAAGKRERALGMHCSADDNQESLQANLKIKKQFSVANTELKGWPWQLSSNHEPPNNTEIDNELDDCKISSKAKKEKQTQRLNELRKAADSKKGLNQLASVEFEILNTLMNPEIPMGGGCCSRRKNLVAETQITEDVDELSFPTGKFTDQDFSAERIGASTDQIVAMTSNSIESRIGSSEILPRKATYGESTDTIAEVEVEDVDSEDDDIFEELDIRGCECTAIHARVCMDLSKHYRHAEQFGKCFAYLLDAADSYIIIGNCSQAQNYLDEATLLLKEIKDGTITIPVEHPEEALNEKSIRQKILLLQGIVYYKTQSYAKSKPALLQALRMMGQPLPEETDSWRIKVAIGDAQHKLWRINHGCGCIKPMNAKGKMAALTPMKIRSLIYLQRMYIFSNNTDMAILAAMWEVILSEKLGGSMEDAVPAYCRLMDLYMRIGEPKKAIYYEEKALGTILEQGFKKPMNALALMTVANLFLTLSRNRNRRGEIQSCIQANYLSLQISTILFDWTLQIHAFPILIHSLMCTLKLTEVVESLHTLWCLAISQDHRTGTALYVSLVMNMILELCCPIEPFYYCEQFATTSSDWDEDSALFEASEVRFNFEASLTLWYSRFYKWEEALEWRLKADLHKPAATTIISVTSYLKLLESYLIRANYLRETQELDLSAVDKKRAKKLITRLYKWTKIVPVCKPRFYHLLAYYSQIHEGHQKTQSHLQHANRIAEEQGNLLELEYLKHTRLVWYSEENYKIQVIKNFWIDNAEGNVVDRKFGHEIPWSSIMYSLPISPSPT